jgi:thioredoxin-related protein
MIKKIFGISLLGFLILAGCMHAPMHERRDMSLPLTNSSAIDLNAALARARAENKVVLLDFTGSDWCPPCIELHKEIFSQPGFQSYAESNLVFLTVDFPSRFRLSPEANATNDFLSEKFDVEGFPTLVALNGDGKVIWQHLGFIEGGPGKFITTFETAKAKSK